MKSINAEFNKYKDDIQKIFIADNYTEYSFRFSLEKLITSIISNINMIHEPKREKGLGAPDYTIYIGGTKVGYIETKNIDVNLNVEISSDQIKRYIESIDNLILTNYKRFILIRNHSIIEDFNLISESLLKKGIFTIVDKSIESFLRMIDGFCVYKIPIIKSSQELAYQLSKKAKLLKYYAKEQLDEDIRNFNQKRDFSKIFDFYQSMKLLIPDLSSNDCADAYAQTITYGFFLAKIYSKNNITRSTALSYIPENIPIIKTMFINISGYSLPPYISWIPDEIIDVLNSTDMKPILDEISQYDQKSIRDPFSFFYEHFIEQYDPEKRKMLGVYYTPRPVVNYIVNNVHNILKQWFNKENGFSNDDVTVLDFAAGTSTFLWMLYIVSLVELINSKKSGLIEGKIRNHILKDFYGFEVMITPYIISHLKLISVLSRWRYQLKDDERIQVFLTNTLEPSEIQGLLYFFRDLTEENKLANKIKGLEKKILVILGNPPYSRISVNNGEWINRLLKEGYTTPDGRRDLGYYMVDGGPLGERNPRWLQDDYVKFIRYAQWKVDNFGEGIVGIITNHSYLDNITFRGMRQSLLNTFDRIYIINLHGHTRKEILGLVGKDENVFDIKQGVAISIFIKNFEFKNKFVFYKDIFGDRQSKYDWLDRYKNINELDWDILEPKSPNYYFIPINERLTDIYDSYWKITDILPENNVGIATTRDGFTISFIKDELIKRMIDFKNGLKPNSFWENKYKLRNKPDWTIDKARTKLSEINIEDNIFPILYRPFDIRWIIYNKAVVERPRTEIMENMISRHTDELDVFNASKNVALLVSRTSAKTYFTNVLITDILTEIKSAESTRATYIIPLFLHVEKDGHKKWVLNISDKFITYFMNKYRQNKLDVENLLGYIYAILNSTKYRKKYSELLKKDFPRIPFVDDYKTYIEISKIGRELILLHLLRSKPNSITTFDVQGDCIVNAPKYKNGNIYINDKQYIDNVTEEIWDFEIGGNKVVQKWLNYRQNIKLDLNDIQHIMNVIDVIRVTIQKMGEIDSVLIL